jgi:hypothetical protein
MSEAVSGEIGRHEASLTVPGPSLDEQIRDAVRQLMGDDGEKSDSLAKIQQLAEMKAASVRAPFAEKIKRIKESA